MQQDLKVFMAGFLYYLMVFGIPLAIWFGVMTIISAGITFSLGIAMHFFRKDVFRYHAFFAFTTIILAIIHAVLAYFLWFKGIIL